MNKGVWSFFALLLAALFALPGIGAAEETQLEKPYIEWIGRQNRNEDLMIEFERVNNAKSYTIVLADQNNQSITEMTVEDNGRYYQQATISYETTWLLAEGKYFIRLTANPQPDSGMTASSAERSFTLYDGVSAPVLTVEDTELVRWTDTFQASFDAVKYNARENSAGEIVYDYASNYSIELYNTTENKWMNIGGLTAVQQGSEPDSPYVIRLATDELPEGNYRMDVTVSIPNGSSKTARSSFSVEDPRDPLPRPVLSDIQDIIAGDDPLTVTFDAVEGAASYEAYIMRSTSQYVYRYTVSEANGKVTITFADTSDWYRGNTTLVVKVKAAPGGEYKDCIAQTDFTVITRYKQPKLSTEAPGVLVGNAAVFQIESSSVGENMEIVVTDEENNPVVFDPALTIDHYSLKIPTETLITGKTYTVTLIRKASPSDVNIIDSKPGTATFTMVNSILENPEGKIVGTPKANNSAVIRFEWQPVEGAAFYDLCVYDEFKKSYYSDPVKIEYVRVNDIPAGAVWCEVDMGNCTFRTSVAEDIWKKLEGGAGSCKPLTPGKKTLLIGARSDSASIYGSTTTYDIRVAEPDAGDEFIWHEESGYAVIDGVYGYKDVTIPSTLNGLPVLVGEGAFEEKRIPILRVNAGAKFEENAFRNVWRFYDIWIDKDFKATDWPANYLDLGFDSDQYISWHVYRGTEAYAYAQEMVSQSKRGSVQSLVGKLPTPQVQVDSNGYEYGWNHCIEFDYDWGFDKDYAGDIEYGFNISCPLSDSEDDDGDIFVSYWSANNVIRLDDELEPGNYTCNLRAYADGWEDSDPAVFTIKILPLGELDVFDRYNGWKFDLDGENVGVWHYALVEKDHFHPHDDDESNQKYSRVYYSYRILDENGETVQDKPTSFDRDYDHLEEEDEYRKMYAVTFDQYHWQEYGYGPGNYTLVITAKENYLNETRTVEIPFEIISKYGRLDYLQTEKGFIVTGPKDGETAKNFVIPETRITEDGKEVPVVAIGENAFKDSSVTITIPKSVITIPENAIPKSAQVITPQYSPAWFYGEKYEWKNMKNDESVTISTFIMPSHLSTLSADALSGTSVECVILPAGSGLEAAALANCGNLKVVAFESAPKDLNGSIFGEGDNGAGILLVNAGSTQYTGAEKLDGVEF